MASVPRYSRLTDPPGKKTLSLRDAMPPDLSEHFCVGPCCTALQPSGARQVRATGDPTFHKSRAMAVTTRPSFPLPDSCD